MSGEKIVLGPITGAVDHEKAKIWFYGTKGPDQEEVLCKMFYKHNNELAADEPFVFNAISENPYRENDKTYLPYLTTINFPDPGKEYFLKIEYKEGTQSWVSDKNYFITPFPGDGDVDFSFGLISCHKVFQSYKKHHKRIKMWEALGEKLAHHDAKFLLQAGDQIYGDAKENNAWEKCQNVTSHLERLKYYRDVYFDSWGFEQVQDVMSMVPQFMIWDDHEVTDGWGAKKDHFTGKNPGIIEIAKMAYIEFQHSHNPDSFIRGEFFYAFHYGNAAFFVLDTRSHRSIKEDVLLGKTQKEVFEKWIQSPKVSSAKVLFLVSSVPVFHLSRDLWSFGKIIDDAADQWTYKGNRKARRWLLKNLFEWSGNDNKPVYILGGDVHVGTEVCMAHMKRKQVIQQITSSPITNRVSGFLDFITAFVSKNIDGITDWDGEDSINVKIVRRHRKKNFAIIEVIYENGRPKVLLNMYRRKEESARTSKRDLEEKSKNLFLR